MCPIQLDFGRLGVLSSAPSFLRALRLAVNSWRVLSPRAWDRTQSGSIRRGPKDRSRRTATPRVSYIQQLTFLPSYLNGGGISVNYSYAHSNASGVPDRTGPVALERQAPNTWNISHTWDHGRVSVRVCITYFVTGGGGAHAYPIERSPDDRIQNSEINRHYLVANVTRNAMTITMNRLELKEGWKGSVVRG